MAKYGNLFIVAAPSGAGKTSLVKALVTTMPNIQVSVSYTTRAIRNGERDGVDYHFVTLQQFQEMVEKQAFIEHATVFDRHYGTGRQWLEEKLASGTDVVLEIDWQGARQVRSSRPDAIGIFVLPPSRRILEERLQRRAQDSPDIIARRMRDAVSEMSHYSEFDFLIVNDNFEMAQAELKMIVTAMRLRTGVRRDLEPLLQQLLAKD